MGNSLEYVNKFYMNNLTEKQKKILLYLEEEVRDFEYLKSKNISEDIDELSSKEIGSNLLILKQLNTQFKIEKWSESNSTTWKISRK